MGRLATEVRLKKAGVFFGINDMNPCLRVAGKSKAWRGQPQLDRQARSGQVRTGARLPVSSGCRHFRR
jgi:hypothetical protein